MRVVERWFFFSTGIADEYLFGEHVEAAFQSLCGTTSAAQTLILMHINGNEQPTTTCSAALATSATSETCMPYNLFE